MAAITQHYDDTVFTQFITSQDVEDCAKCATSSAPGPDGVRYSHIKTWEQGDLCEFASKLNDSLWSGDLTVIWQQSLNQTSTKIAAYRILTMQNTVGKLPENVFFSVKLPVDLEEKGSLPPEQGCYRRGKVAWNILKHKTLCPTGWM